MFWKRLSTTSLRRPDESETDEVPGAVVSILVIAGVEAVELVNSDRGTFGTSDKTDIPEVVLSVGEVSVVVARFGSEEVAAVLEVVGAVVIDKDSVVVVSSVSYETVGSEDVVATSGSVSSQSALPALQEESTAVSIAADSIMLILRKRLFIVNILPQQPEVFLPSEKRAFRPLVCYLSDS